MHYPVVSRAQARQELKKLANGWTTKGVYLERQLKFKDFKSAVRFINQVTKLAEKVQHHPDLNLHDYNRLDIRISTHDAKALPEWDFQLAKKIDGVVETTLTCQQTGSEGQQVHHRR